MPSNYEVHSEDGVFYSVYLMKSELKANNNKFYIVQVLKKKSTNDFWTFVRYGRVGTSGTTSLNYHNRDGALKYFLK